MTASQWHLPADPPSTGEHRDVTLECGWGRLIFGQTFGDDDRMLEVLRAEAPGRRDICVYVRDPHVLVARAPHELFIDPSYVYRLALDTPPEGEPPPGATIRPMSGAADAEAVNRLYELNRMVPAQTAAMLHNLEDDRFTYLVAEDPASGEVVGTVTGVDHHLTFGDPEQGTSLWCLAVSPHCTIPGVGEALVRALADGYRGRGRAYLDLSVLHDNEPAIRLYEKLGFVRVPAFSVKRKNPINEPLFASSGTDGLDQLNPYAAILAREARRRGIAVEVTDPEWGEMRLSHGGRSILTRESLSELTTAVAMSRCDDKRVTRRILERAGLKVPRGRVASFDDADLTFVRELGEAVVKPARGEQGRGITVGVDDEESLRAALDLAQTYCPDVLVEECVDGLDLRVVVIDHEVVAAAVRRPATVVGTGRHTVLDLIKAASRRASAATEGESTIPLDDTTMAVVKAAGYSPDDVLPEGESLAVRRTANLHTGGTMHDVTSELHPTLIQAAVEASRAIGIPVTGIDLLVPHVDGPDYVIIEANERPGLANHEPQPTAERFIDLLFPNLAAPPRAWRPPAPQHADGSAGRD
ncbi:N-acetylglutaminylglutamine synthetase [Nocardioides caldifontis]|uniref:N-acetylglutaminylglutamine synthetase n=1 Tax=Nocardioides caldifontis TaxID=2588938 RepID=UPI0011E04840|nr:N-acetylglutaminylglutamine synthetase [Nocardioides caldifontis]